MCILILYTTFVGIHVKYPVFLSDFNETWIVLTDFRENLKYHVSSKFIFRACVRTDGRTDMTKLILFAFRNFANAPKNTVYSVQIHNRLWAEHLRFRDSVPSGSKRFLLQSVQINSRPAIQCIRAGLDPQVNGRCVKLTGSLYLISGLQIAEIYPPPQP
jgi:hypothetical protein